MDRFYDFLLHFCLIFSFSTPPLGASLFPLPSPTLPSVLFSLCPLQRQMLLNGSITFLLHVRRTRFSQARVEDAQFGLSYRLRSDLTGFVYIDPTVYLPRTLDSQKKAATSQSKTFVCLPVILRDTWYRAYFRFARQTQRRE